MKGILSIDTEADELVIDLEGEVSITLNAEGMSIQSQESTSSVDWEAADRICNLARGAKVIYASGGKPKLVGRV